MAAESEYIWPESSEREPMVAVFIDGNKLVLSPGAVAELQLRHGDYFEVSVQDEGMALTLIQDSTMETIWAKIEALGITEQDVADAVQWARGR